jgi:ABC-type polysaccharide/polyol phosphate export permease
VVAKMQGSARTVPIYDSSVIRIRMLHELTELMRYRFLIWNLVVRDLKVRYKRSFLGFIWVMLSPLLQMVVMYVVFSQILRFSVAHYAIYLLVGILAFNLFSQSTVSAMGNLQSNAAILRKLYVPPSVFVASAIGSALVNFVFALGPLVAIAIFNGLSPSLVWLFILVPSMLTALFAMGIGLIVSALFVFFHDIFEIYQVLINLYYFLTPVMYPLTTLPQPLRDWEAYNPLYLYLDMTRNAVIRNALPAPETLLLAAGLSIAVLIVGWLIFTRVEDRFVYHI